MTIIDAIKKGLKAAGVNEKYASKVQKLFKIEKEEDIEVVSKRWHNLFYAQSPDFHKPGLCYYPQFLYL